MNRMGYRGQGNMGMIPGGPLGKAKYALATGDAEEAERICRKRLERQPDDAAARVLLAQTLLQMQQADEAAVEARRALTYQPKNVEGLMVLSSALLQRGGLGGVPAEAERTARRAVELQPNSANTHIQLGEVLLRKRDFAGARSEVDKAIKLEPRSPGAYLMRALILLSDKDPEGAIQASDTAIRHGRQLAPGSLAQADFIKANALIQLNRNDEALIALDTAERQNPLLGGGQAYTMRGRIYFKQRKYKQSYAQFLLAQRLSGRLLWLAPVLAGVNMVLVGLFGERAPVMWAVLLAVIVLLVLFGISYIPVVGPWIVTALVVALAGVFALTALRTLRGRILPEEQLAKFSTAAVGGAVFIAAGAGVLWLENLINSLLHTKTGFITPVSLGVAGVVAVALAAGAMYGWPLLLGRYAGRTPAAAS
jgi:tetratricopeptide (TPR) repeat protein